MARRLSAGVLLAVGLIGALLAGPGRASAHHGWSSYDTSQPRYVSGTITEVIWQNPHVEVRLAVPADLALPPDLAEAALPEQFEGDGGRELFRAAALPSELGREWLVVLAPIGRMQSWGVLESSMPRPGDTIAAVAYQGRGELDEMRAEAFVFADGSVIPLRRNAETALPPRPPAQQQAPTEAPPTAAPTEEPPVPTEVQPTAAPTEEPPVPTEVQPTTAAVATPVAQAATTPPANAPSDAAAATQAAPAGPAPGTILLGVLLLLGVAGGALWYVRRRS